MKQMVEAGNAGDIIRKLVRSINIKPSGVFENFGWFIILDINVLTGLL